MHSCCTISDGAAILSPDENCVAQTGLLNLAQLPTIAPVTMKIEVNFQKIEICFSIPESLFVL
jgi:hypothetical protein